MRATRRESQERQPRRLASADRASRSEPWISAGGVVFKQDYPGDLAVALVGRVRGGRSTRWALPKGTQRPSEALENTAVREVQEETGLIVRLLLPIDRIHYTFMLAGVRYQKTVHFYLMYAIGGDTADHDHEYDFARWFSVNEALIAMAYPNEARLVQRAVGLFDDERTSNAMPTVDLPDPAGLPFSAAVTHRQKRGLR